MTETILIGNKSVQWVDQPQVIDQSFFDDVPLIPEKMRQGNVDSLMGSAVDKLFEYNQPEPWAHFAPFVEYRNSIKRLFSSKVLATFDPDFARETLDNFFENEGDMHEEEGGKLYEMLEELTHLNVILEEIYLKILSCLKP